MRGIIIYEKESANKNAGYINWYMDKFKAAGISLELVMTDEADYGVLKGHDNAGLISSVFPVGASIARPPDFAIVRAMRPDLTKKLESLGVRCFNNGFVSEIGNDKALTYDYVKKNGIDIMPVYNNIDDIREYPVVIKPTRSHGGDRVYSAESREKLESLLPLYPDGYVIQALASDIGRDLRVYVIGKNIVTAMLRRSDKDIRSNFSLGGSAEVYTLNADEIRAVRRITELFKPDFAGIDFVFDNGVPVFNEIEDVVGSRMVYTYTDIDIVDIYVKYIIKCMKNIREDKL